MITLRKPGQGMTLRASVVDQSVDGLAIQLGRRCHVETHERVDVLLGETWEPATVTSTTRQGIAHRVGLRWLAQRDELDEKTRLLV